MLKGICWKCCPKTSRSGKRQFIVRRLDVVAFVALVLGSPGIALAQTCTVPGQWQDATTSEFGGQITVNPDLTGTMQLDYASLLGYNCYNTVSITLIGTIGFQVVMTPIANSGAYCGGATESLTFGPLCDTASGTYTNDDGEGSGSDTWTLQAQITLSRTSLTEVQATAAPTSGTFSYPTSPISGSNVATVSFAGGNSNTTNPNNTDLQAPASGGAPTPGGLEMITAQYTNNGATATDPFQVPTFGMSCYMIALESDYGTPPNSCSTTTLNGVNYSGSVTNPDGLSGTYCAAFIVNVQLQGAGQLKSGSYVQYQTGSGNIVTVSSIKGHDGTALIPGGSVARDLSIIPSTGVLVDVDQVGTGLLANDTGGAIVGYRLDLFNGSGKAACAGYSNPIGVSACETPQAACPGSALQ